jgi:hypothetical protein
MSQHEVGRVRIVSGWVSCGDPLTADYEADDPGFAQEVPPGEYTVEVAVAQVSADDARVACARVRFDDEAAAVRWEPALYEGEEAPEDGGPAGSGVDSGTWGFFDAGLSASVDEVTSQRWLAALERNMVSTWTHLDGELGAGNVVMMSSGWGDGFYGSYWGRAEDGRVVELVTDFEVLMGPVEVGRVSLSSPVPRGKVPSEDLERHGFTARVPRLGRRVLLLDGKGSVRVIADDNTPVEMEWRSGVRRYSWPKHYMGNVTIVLSKGRAPFRAV